MAKKHRPKGGIIVSYKDLFGKGQLPNRLDYLKGHSKKMLLTIFASLNTSRASGSILGTSFDGITQLGYLRQFLLENEPLYRRIAHTLGRMIKSEEEPIVFSRAANLIALNEILENDFESEDDQFIDSEAILRYYLCVNDVILKKQELDGKKDANDLLEAIFAGASPTNELGMSPSLFHDLFRNSHLSAFLKNHPTYGEPFKQYFQEIGFKPEIVALVIFRMIANAIRQENKISPLFFPPQDEQEDIILNYYAPLNPSISSGKPPLEVFNVKKYPLFNFGDGRFLLLDASFLLDKLYNSLINDFFFDHLRKVDSSKYNRSHYMGVIGYFFENHIANSLKEGFRNLTHPRPLFLDDLKVHINGQEEELADIYIRHNKKVLLGEIKVSAIKSNDKYASDIESFFMNDKNKFYERFGVEQVIGSIKSLTKFQQTVDPKLPLNKNLKIFPIIVFNERLLQTPLFGCNLHKHFSTRLKTEIPEVQIPKRPARNITLGSYIIYPLVAIHTDEIEILEPLLVDKKIDFWELLKRHISTTELHLPLLYTISTKLKQFKNYDYNHYHMEKIRPLLEALKHEGE